MSSASEDFRMFLGFNVTLGKMQKDDWKKVKKCIPNCWYNGLTDFFVTINSTSEIIELTDSTPIMEELRENDKFIMKEFINAGVDTNQLKILNYMRMSIQAVTLSDIAMPRGLKINPNAWNLISSNGLRSKYDWPRDLPSFTQNQIKIWQSALHRTFVVPSSGVQCRDIRTSCWLGNWTDKTVLSK